MRWCTFRVWYCFCYCSPGRREHLGPAVALSEGYQTQTALPSVLEELYEKIWSIDPWLRSNIIIFSPETKEFSLCCKPDSTFSWLLRLLVKEGKDPDLQSLQSWRCKHDNPIYSTAPFNEKDSAHIFHFIETNQPQPTGCILGFCYLQLLDKHKTKQNLFCFMACLAVPTQEKL